ncbi:MAG: DoxX family protein [Thermomicrobiales bacterium]
MMMGRQGSAQEDGIYPTVSLGLLLIRVVTGIVFFMHGYQKLVDNGISATQQGFNAMGVPLPDLTAIVVTFVELIGGAALILGAFTAIAGMLLAVDMLSAIFIVHIDAGFFAMNGGFELVLLLGAVALGLAIAGPGQYSVDAMTSVASRLPFAQAFSPSRR